MYEASCSLKLAVQSWGRFGWALGWALSAFFTLAQSPQDKSGVKSSVLSLPSGAGSIEGLGESFEPQLNTGGSSYGVAIALPPGRAGLAPSVRLSYNSFSGNGICGIGWAFEFSSIKRQTDKGFPKYDSGDTFVYDGEELVPLANAGQDWRCENERSFTRLRRIDSDGDGFPDAWEATERNGTRHTFGRRRGQNNSWSVVEHPEKNAAAAFDRTYSWLIDSTTDLHGNQILYEYLPSSNILYPSRITYSHLGENSREVRFEYEARPDAFDDYRPTFSARLDRRLKRIEVRSSGVLVRAYNLAYDYLPGDLTPDLELQHATYLDLGVTLLKRIVQVDRSGNDANHLPPLIFTYTGLDLTKAEQRAFASPPELDLAEPNGRVQLADLDGDALPDLFATLPEGAGKVQRVCLNRGESRTSGTPKVGFAPAKLVLGSSPIDLAEPNTVVHDPKGKGLVDLSCLLNDGPNKRLETFGNRAKLDVVDENQLGFSQENLEATVLNNPPAFVTYSAPGTRQMDVNFDKRGDFVNLEPGFGAMRVNSFFIDRGGLWTTTESILPSSYPLANTFAGPDGQPNPCVQLADMNGDRMLDLVCLTLVPGTAGQRIQVNYWPLCGLGRYADERTIANAAADAFEIGTGDLRDVFVEDFTGDGLADVLLLDGSGPTTSLILRVNVAGQRWSPPFVRSGLPRYAPRDPAQPTILRLADLNANGSTDLVFRNTSPQSEWAYVELLPGGSPSLMTGIDNSLGKRTVITYGTASEDEQHARETGHPWRTYAPIPLQVVRQIRTTSGQDLNGDGQEDAAVVEFRYRDPYYDGFEREFRGFAFAQRTTYGDDFVYDLGTGSMGISSGWDIAKTPTGQVSGPSVVSRFRFYTGAADQRDNDDYVGTPPPDRQIDEFTELGGREEEALKGLQVVEEHLDPVVLHSAVDADFDAGCEVAATATTLEAQARLTPDPYVYTRLRQDWTVRRLYRPAEAVPYFADQNADGTLEDYRTAPAAPVPAGRFGGEGAVVLPGNGRSVTFVFESAQAVEIREANGHLATALGHPAVPVAATLVTYDYDDFGNQITMRNLGRADAAIDDERIVTTTYALGGNALSLWVISKPDSVTTTDENGAFVARSVYFYDGDPFVGVRAQIQSRALESRRIDHIDADHSLQGVRTGYDAHGNVVETRDPVGNVRRTAWDAQFQTYPVTETIVVGGGVPDLKIEAEYDPGFGVIIQSKDFNGNITTYSYDSFARLTRTVRPGDTPDFPTAIFEYQPADPIRGRGYTYDANGTLTLTAVPLGTANRVTTRQREESGKPGQYITITYTDGIGRKLATLEEGEQPNTWMVRQATSYNLRGQIKSQWLPYQISSLTIPQFPAIWPAGRPPQEDGVNPAIVATDFAYDPQGREIRTLAPPEIWGGPRRETRTHHVPFQQWHLDEEDLRVGSPQADTPRIEFSDGLGRIIAVEESVRLTDAGQPGPLNRWRTEYRYDLNDQVIQTKDSQGNLKQMVYDSLRRMTTLDDPDRGRSTFVYDDASNLRESIDAKGQRITYTYDGANRIKTEDYHDGRPNGVDVEFFYDAPAPGVDLGDGTTGAARGARGQIAFVRDLSGETHFSYDSRARIEWEIKRVFDPAPPQLVSYRTRFAYDSFDRLTVLTFPDGDEERYTYNSRNLVSRIHGASLGDVISAIDYRPSGQIGQITYGNQVRTRYTYDPRLRLSDLETGKNLQPRLIDSVYTYDGLANVTRIEDQRELTGQPEAAQRHNTQDFFYDSLFRLVQVQYPNLGAATSRQITYRYDRIGNMLSQTSDIVHVENGLPVADLGSMSSGGDLGRSNRGPRKPTDPPGPHALTAAGSRVYTYDPNGNVTALDGLVSEWDFKDRLVATESDRMRAVYDYDYLGRRITKTIHWKTPGPDKGDEHSPLNPAWRRTTTHYINRHFEIRDHDAVVKYIWNKHTRVARLTASLGAATRIQHLRLREGWNHVCAAVAGVFPVLDPGNNSAIAACTMFSASAPGAGLLEVTATTPVPAGAILWVYARQDTTVVLTGAGAPNSLPALTGQSQFGGNLLSEPIDLSALAPPSAWLARYDVSTGSWTHRLPTAQGAGAINPTSLLILPGRAFWTTGAASDSLSRNLEALQVRYYHQDHLGSTTVITDRDGSLVEESSNYPFGYPRHHFQSRASQPDPYGFAQKEQDAESGLHYFEARYLASAASRFVSVDPIFTINMSGLGRLPQNLNPYAYSLNNPLKYIDPMGMEVAVSTSEDKKTGEKTTSITITGALIDDTATLTDNQLKNLRARIVKEVSSDFKGKDSDAKQSWNITVDIRIVKKESDLKAKDHVIRIVDEIDSDPDTLGDVNKIGGKTVRIAKGVIPKKPSDPGNASLERTSAHELGHTLGLRHDTDESNPIRAKMEASNLMRQTGNSDGTKINVHQIREMQKLYNDKKLNQ